MLSEYKRLETQIYNLQKQLDELPPGKIILSHDGKNYKWYQKINNIRTYIPKKNRLLAEQLAVKKYLSVLIEELSHEKQAINFYLRHHHSNGGKAEQLLTIPEYRDLLTPYFTPLSQELSDWMNSSYTRNSQYPEHLIHRSYSGNLVRSKSEAIIDMFLYTNKIPFRYECALELGGFTIFPDFTIRHPKTASLFYWEHFGLMDNPDYSQNANSKLQLYISHGIIPSIQLITTYETKETPLSAELVQKIITHYFL